MLIPGKGHIVKGHRRVHRLNQKLNIGITLIEI